MKWNGNVLFIPIRETIHSTDKDLPKCVLTDPSPYKPAKNLTRALKNAPDKDAYFWSPVRVDGKVIDKIIVSR